jgi:hypothetical protein
LLSPVLECAEKTAFAASTNSRAQSFITLSSCTDIEIQHKVGYVDSAL